MLRNESVDLTRYGDNSSYWYYDFTGMGRSALTERHTLSVKCGNDTIEVIDLSALSYAYRVVNKTETYPSTSTLYKLACALYEYATATTD